MSYLHRTQSDQPLERTAKAQIQTVLVEMDQEDAELLWQHSTSLDLSTLPVAEGAIGGRILAMEEVQGKQT